MCSSLPCIFFTRKPTWKKKREELLLEYTTTLLVQFISLAILTSFRNSCPRILTMLFSTTHEPLALWDWLSVKPSSSVWTNEDRNSLCSFFATTFQEQDKLYRELNNCFFSEGLVLATLESYEASRVNKANDTSKFERCNLGISLFCLLLSFFLTSHLLAL